MNQLDNVHYYYHYLKHFEYLGLYHLEIDQYWVIYLDLLFFVLPLVSLITSHWSTSDQSIYCKSLLPDTLTQILCFLSWSPANPKTITACDHSLRYLNLSTWLCFSNASGMILLAIFRCFSVFCNDLIHCLC